MLSDNIRRFSRESWEAAQRDLGEAGRAAQRELDRRIQEVEDTYEHSTSWRITKPIRAIGNFLGR